MWLLLLLMEVNKVNVVEVFNSQNSLVYVSTNVAIVLLHEVHN